MEEYKLNPYPRRMWVAKGEPFSRVKSIFKLDEEDSKLTDEEINSKWDAVVLECSKDEYAGYLVFITSSATLESLVHEAVHVALNIYIDCNIDISPEMDPEPLAYLTEYIYSLLSESLK